MTTHLRPNDRVAVIGGSGFIGSHVIPALVGAGHEVLNYDLFDAEHRLPDEVTDVRADLRDTATLTRALAGCDAVLNLAAAHHDFGLTPATFDSVNVGGARSLVRALEHHRIDNLCFYSSVAVYGDHCTRPDESTPGRPVNDYGRTKLEAEGVYRTWRDGDVGRRLLTIRPAVVFGPRNYANVFRMIHQISRRRFYPVGPGINRKSMIYVDNIVAAIMHLWTAPENREVLGEEVDEIYNCVDQPDLASREIIAHVYRALGRRVPRGHLPLGPMVLAAKPVDAIAALTGKNLPITSARIAKLGEAETSFAADRIRRTGYQQPVTLAQGLEWMVQWYQTQSGVKPIEHLPPQEPVIAPAP
ncbi:MAG: NAD-dependent epimerase/dehydratase family protein [Beutenbergiaceae bacterium]